MLFALRSNRTEVLFEGLAERLAVRGRDPLARSVVVVQGPGMERWLAQRLAERFGVCANVAFPFPRPFLDEILGGDAGPWDLDRMTFAIAREIDAARRTAGPENEVFAPLTRSLVSEDGHDRADGTWRLLQLAHRIALVFDQVLTYRPDWVRAWEDPSRPRPNDLPSGVDGAWQARLFRSLVDSLGRDHVVNRAVRLVESLGGTQDFDGRPLRAPESAPRAATAQRLERCFPDAVEIFAVSTIPPLHLAVVRALATVVDVRLSILVPSRVWYSDLWRELRDTEGASGPPIATLLASLGRLGADFQRLLVETTSPDGGEHERFVVPGAGAQRPSLLERLQARLLDLDEESLDPALRRVESGDRSIEVHLCPGPRRELEVVESLLRAAFEADPRLAPEDVIVMAPDIDAIAADIDAVFGSAGDRRGAIPHRIADRGTWRRSAVADALRALLELADSRMARSAVFDWLALPPVAARFGLDERAVESLAEWAERAGHRFGLDEAQRQSLDLPPERAHTLAGSIDRLVLAHALGETQEVVAGITPAALDAFAEPAWIGAIGELEALLGEVVREIRRPRSVVDWSRLLARLASRSIVQNDTNSHEHAAIRSILDGQRAAAEATGFATPIPFAAMRERVLEALEQASAPQAFLAGGVTFCQLVPLRAIPFRIVVVTGLVDGAFPRSRSAQGFDAMAAHPRPGDRTARDDDRHLFLEAILSARERLVLTAPARDLRDGAPYPTSIVVAELLDALDGAFEPAEGGRLRDQLVVEHPLSATSPRYFEPGRNPRLVSRNEGTHRAALARTRAAREPDAAERVFLAGIKTHAAKSPAADTLTLDELVERLLRPTQRYARQVLGLRLPRPEEAVGDLDPVGLSPLERAALGRSLFEALATGSDFETAIERLAVDSRLARGDAGLLVAGPLFAEVRLIAAIAAARRSQPKRSDFPFELVVPALDSSGATTLVGRLDCLHEDARIEAGYVRIDGFREAALWIRHLVLCALALRHVDLPACSVLVGRPPREGDRADRVDRVVELAPASDPLERLAELIAWAARGESVPLPFFERASAKFASTYARAQATESGEAGAWRNARSTFEGWDDQRNRRAEATQDLETVRVWEGAEPITPEARSPVGIGFDALAWSFYAPLLAARRRLRR